MAEVMPVLVAEAEGVNVGSANVASASAEEQQIFRGTSNNVVVSVGLLLAGAMAFFMGFTGTYMQEAMAWTFVVWGGLLLYLQLTEMTEEYEITDEALVIRNPIRFWGRTYTWPWDAINRLDVVVKKTEGALNDEDRAVMQVYHQVPDEPTVLREDRVYNTELAQIIIDRAGLAPEGDSPVKAEDLAPNVKATYTWQ